jgi:hypothetical protein
VIQSASFFQDSPRRSEKKEPSIPAKKRSTRPPSASRVILASWSPELTMTITGGPPGEAIPAASSAFFARRMAESARQ